MLYTMWLVLKREKALEDGEGRLDRSQLASYCVLALELSHHRTVQEAVTLKEHAWLLKLENSLDKFITEVSVKDLECVWLYLEVMSVKGKEFYGDTFPLALLNVICSVTSNMDGKYREQLLELCSQVLLHSADGLTRYASSLCTINNYCSIDGQICL